MKLTLLDHYAAAALTGILADTNVSDERVINLAFKMALMAIDRRNALIQEGKADNEYGE